MSLKHSENTSRKFLFINNLGYHLSEVKAAGPHLKQSPSTPTSTNAYLSHTLVCSCSCAPSSRSHVISDLPGQDEPRGERRRGNRSLTKREILAAFKAVSVKRTVATLLAQFFAFNYIHSVAQCDAWISAFVYHVICFRN